MTTWLTKDLSLDLIAIIIDGFTKMYDRINTDPAAAHPADTPTVPEVKTPVTEATPEPVEDTPEPTQPDPEPEQAEIQDVTEHPRYTEAQTTLRHIVQADGVDWITGTLFPHFGVVSLTDIPHNRLDELITMAQQHHQAAA